MLYCGCAFVLHLRHSRLPLFSSTCVRFIFEDIDRGLLRPEGVTFHALAAQRAAGAEPLRAVIMSVQAPAEEDNVVSEGKGVLEGSGPRPLRSPAVVALPSQPVASTSSSSSLSPTQAELRQMLLRGPQFAGKAKLTFRDCFMTD